MIQPQDQLEYAQECFSRYRPAVEERFEVDLGDYLVKDVESYIADSLKAGKGKGTEEERRQDIIDSLENVVGKHWRALCSIYVINLRPRKGRGIAQTVAHELGHAAHFALIREKRAERVTAWPLGKVFEEGFAEMVELDVMAPHYGLEGICDSLAKVRRSHAKSVGKVHKELRLPRGVLLPPEKSLVEQLREEVRALAYEGRIRRCIERHEGSEYPLGFAFFWRALDRGIPLEEVLMHPPKNLLQAVVPDLYVRELRP